MTPQWMLWRKLYNRKSANRIGMSIIAGVSGGYFMPKTIDAVAETPGNSIRSQLYEQGPMSGPVVYRRNFFNLPVAPGAVGMKTVSKKGEMI